MKDMNIIKQWNAFRKSVLSRIRNMRRGSVRAPEGRAALILGVNSVNAPQGEEIVGTVLLKGGAVPQQKRLLVIRLKELHQNGDSSEWKTISEVVTAYFDLAPGQTREVPFRLSIPFKARLSSTSNGTRVTADTNLRLVAKTGVSVNVKVTPPLEIMALDTALQQLGFVSRQYNFVPVIPFLPSLASRKRLVTKFYHAPSALAEQTTGVTLQLALDASHVAGQLILNHPKSNLPSVLRAAMGENKQIFPIEMPRNLLSGGNSVKEARTSLRSLLNQALIMPDNQANWMLRASAPPPDAGNTLLRAADSTLETNPEQLLHASEQIKI